MSFKQLRKEEIYETVFADDALDTLSDRLAALVGARSATLHWREGDGAVVELATNYFPADGMARYPGEFAHRDPWSNGVVGANLLNTAVDALQIVGEDEYERSDFYNDFIRGMHDDSWYCIGAVCELGSGKGFVGLHRGRRQDAFSKAELNRLSGVLPDVRMALSLRSRLWGEVGMAGGWLSALDNDKRARMIVDSDGQVVAHNSAAANLFAYSQTIALRGGRLVLADRRQEAIMAWHLMRATAANAPEGGHTLVGVSTGAAWTVELVPLVSGRWAGRALVTFTPRPAQVTDAALIETLCRAYGMTVAEAQVSCALADGASPEDIADMRGTSVHTIRSQLKQAMAKTGVRRSTQLVSLIVRIGLP